MNKKIIAVAAFGILLGAGCGGKTAVNENANIDPNANTNVAAENTNSATTSTPATNENTNSGTNTNTAANKPTTTAPAKTSFLVEVDDNGFYPASGTAKKGSTVTVTFKSRTSNVLYNGLNIRSNKYDVGYVKGGTSKSVTFPAEATITFSSFWSTGAYKSAWTLYVK
jgi:plastocyanin